MSFLYISTSVVLFLYSFICLLCLFLFYLCIGNCKLSSIHFLWPPSTLIFSIVTNYAITFAVVLICDFRPLCQFSIFWLFSKDDHLHFRSVMKYISCYYFSWNMWSFLGFLILVSQKFRPPPKLPNFVKFGLNFAKIYLEISTWSMFFLKKSLV